MEIKIHVPFLFWKYRLVDSGRYFLCPKIDMKFENKGHMISHGL